MRAATESYALKLNIIVILSIIKLFKIIIAVTDLPTPVINLLILNKFNPIQAGVFLLSNYHQPCHDSTIAQNLSRAVKVKSKMTSL